MTFHYANSDHVDSTPREAATPAPAAQVVPSLVPPPTQAPTPSEPPPLDYNRTNVEPPKGASDDVVPANIREMREADADRKMFTPQRNYAQSVPDHPGDTPEMVTVRAEGREIMADIGLSDPEARDVISIMSTELADGVPSAETVGAWQQEALTDVLRQYGKDAPAKIAAARALVARDPRVQRLLDETGLGSHPRVVRMLIDKAQSERMRGRLK